MIALIVKDLRCLKGTLPFAACYSLLFLLGFLLIGEAPFPGFVYVVSAVAGGYTVLLASIGNDRGDTHRFLLSMPVTRRDAVNAKFLLLACSVAVVFAVAAVIGCAARVIAPSIGLGAPSSMHAVRVTGGAMLFTVVLPFYFRFGSQMMRSLLVAAVGVGVVVQIAAAILLGVRTDGGRLEVVDAVLRFFEASDQWNRNLWLLAAGAAVCTVSYLVSLRIHLRCDL